MNVKSLFAAAAVALVGVSAYAQEGVQWPDASVQSTRSRAEVQAEVKQAQADGSLAQASDSYGRTPVAVSQKTRADVVAEVARARAAGTLPIVNEGGNYLPEAFVSTRSRDEVRAEARAAARNSRIDTRYIGG